VRKVRGPSEAEIINRPQTVWRKLKRRQGTPEAQFRRILARAKESSSSPRTLRGIIRILGLELQSVNMSQILRQSDDPDIPEGFQDLFFSESMPLTRNGKTLNDLSPQITRRRRVDMLRDILLPWPWNYGRFQGIFGTLGRHDVEWETDYNHKIEMHLPMRLCFVQGGNHSLTAGFALGKVGELRSIVVRDLTPAMRAVYADGKVFRRFFDDRVISRVGVVEAAAIWEVSRLMLKT